MNIYRLYTAESNRKRAQLIRYIRIGRMHIMEAVLAAVLNNFTVLSPVECSYMSL